MMEVQSTVEQLAEEPRPGRQLAELCRGREGLPAKLPDGLVARLDRLVSEIARAAGPHTALEVAWEPLLVERARLLGLAPQGRISANGSCRILRGADGWLALNLARPEDLAAVGALVGAPNDRGWDDVEAAALASTTQATVTRARLLGLPAAGLSTPAVTRWRRPWPARTWWHERLWPATRARYPAEVHVVDLSALWAGPLACQILQRAGAAVTKVESAARPDAARRVPDFYRRLHPTDQPCEVLDFATASGRRDLRHLIETADVVVEGSRPRALEQLGCGPTQLASRPGRVWLSITGYGRHSPNGGWVAFGDDAAVGGGLVARDSNGDPVFCGDAVADPVTGLVGAFAVMQALQEGGGALLDVAMASCAASAAGSAGAVACTDAREM